MKQGDLSDICMFSIRETFPIIRVLLLLNKISMKSKCKKNKEVKLIFILNNFFHLYCGTFRQIKIIFNYQQLPDLDS